MRKLSRRIEQIENELETIEERLEEISAAMLETNDVAELSDLQKELDDLSDSQEALMEEWSDLSRTNGRLRDDENLFMFWVVKGLHCWYNGLSI